MGGRPEPRGGDPYFERLAAAGIAELRLDPDLAELYLMRRFPRDTAFCETVHIRGVDGKEQDRHS